MKFDVLYVDPPWKFRNEKTGGNHKSGASQKYPVMELPAICNLPAGAIAHSGSVLFLWVPVTMKFSHAPRVAQAWGFPNYITTVYWDKDRLGMGFYYRNCVEELLVFGTAKGSVAPFGCQRRNLIRCPPGEHSAKPEEFRRLIEESTKKISRRQCVELFALKKVPGWTPVGNQVTGRHVQEDLKLLASGDEGMNWP